MKELLSPADLDQIADVIGQGPYEGYPQHVDRLRLDTPGLHLQGATLVIPDGPWHITGHSNRQHANPELLDPEVPVQDYPAVNPLLTERWLAEGLTLDQYGRPVHPDWQQLLGDDRIGMPTGLGFFYKYGANATVDPAVYRTQPQDMTEVLLIQRGIGRRWALPGGFLDRSDASAAAGARRELGEETRLTDAGGSDEVILYKRPVGLRDTLNAWTENTLVLIHGDQDYLHDTEPECGSDAIDVGWFNEQQIGQLDIFDAHSQYIAQVFRHLREAV